MSDLKNVFRQAAEIAQSVPENMQVAAFNRALDFLTLEAGKEAKLSRRSKSSQNGTAKKPEPKVSLDRSDSATKPPKAARKSSSGLAPKAAVNSLIESGFFASGKTRAEVQAHLRTTRGYNIGGDQLGVAMLRLVRDGALERAENQDGQYEFKRRTM
jgi:hypothetical protein